MRVVILAGADLAHVSYEAGDSQNRTGIVAGVGAVKPLGTNWSIEPELTYAMKGGVATDGTTELTRALSYLEIPLLFRYDADSLIAVRPFVQVGPALAFRVGCRVASKGATSVSESCAGGAAGGQARPIDLGAMAGIGLAVKPGRQTLSLGVRYNYGMMNLYDEATLRSRVWSIVGTLELPWGS
jgi:hypothetical protein